MKNLLSVRTSATLIMTVFLTLSFIYSPAQQLLTAYKSLYKADSLVQAGDYQAALDLDINSEKALKDAGLVDRDIAGLFLRLKNTKKADYYINKSVRNGVDIDRLNGNPFIKTYLISINYSANSSAYLANRKIYNCSIGYPDQRIEILQMLERDQAVRNLIPFLDHQLLNKLVYQVDSVNYDELKGIIKNGHFPGYAEVGLDGESAFFELMLHIPIGQITKKGEFDVLDSLMLKEVKSSNFSPFDYALIVDRYSYTIFREQIYGTYWEYDRVKKTRVVMKIKNIKDVDMLRKTIFLPSLELSRKQGLLLPDDYKN